MNDKEKSKRKSFTAIAIGTWRRAEKDDVFGAAAQLAYYLMLALFPMLIFLTSLIAYLPGVHDNIVDTIGRFAPPEAIALVKDTLADIVKSRSGGLISFGAIGTLWAASSGVAALISSLNTAYDVKETRPYWKQRLAALGLTILLLLLGVTGNLLFLFGAYIVERGASIFDLGELATWLWKAASYFLGTMLAVVAIDLLYYLGPDTQRRFRWGTIGGVFAVASIIASSKLFSLYLHVGPGYSATYGSLGTVVVLMLWLYLVGLSIMFGAEINTQIKVSAEDILNLPSS
jgi:membrane protein